MAATVHPFIVCDGHLVTHDGTDYHAGDVVELTSRNAKWLLDKGVICKQEDTDANADSADTAGDGDTDGVK